MAKFKERLTIGFLILTVSLFIYILFWAINVRTEYIASLACKEVTAQK